MSNAFNPFSASAQAPVAAPTAPVYAAPSAVAQTASSLGSLNQVANGFGAPLFPQSGVDGQYRLQITGYSGGIGYESGPAVHITFKIAGSSNANISIGQEYRLFYKYDYERNQPVAGKQGSVHKDLLSHFISALHNKSPLDPSLDKVAEQARLHTHDWATQPGFVDLHCTCRDWKAPSGSVEKKRRETWVSVPR